MELLNIAKEASDATSSDKAPCSDGDKLVDAVERAVAVAMESLGGAVSPKSLVIEGKGKDGPDLDRYVREAQAARASAESAWTDLRVRLAKSTPGQQVGLLDAYLTAVGPEGPHADDARSERSRIRESQAKSALAKLAEVAQMKALATERKKAAIAEWLAEYGDTALAPEAQALLDGLEGKGDMVSVPAGAFFMGCNAEVDRECEADEKPGRRVQVEAFRIDRTEVTVAEYRRCVDAGACAADGLKMQFWDDKDQGAGACNWDKPGKDSHPINCVDWSMATAFCRWAKKRLPTEGEWEKAARGTDGRKYPWGNAGYGSKRVANIADESAKRDNPGWTTAEGYDDGVVFTAPAGSFSAGASPYGALDMIGNVAEWNSDWYEVNKYRSLRGGSWNNGPSGARASDRGGVEPAVRVDLIGFRCAQ